MGNWPCRRQQKCMEPVHLEGQKPAGFCFDRSEGWTDEARTAASVNVYMLVFKAQLKMWGMMSRDKNACCCECFRVCEQRQHNFFQHLSMVWYCCLWFFFIMSYACCDNCFPPVFFHNFMCISTIFQSLPFISETGLTGTLKYNVNLPATFMEVFSSSDQNCLYHP